jgi:hypothetical protein
MNFSSLQCCKNQENFNIWKWRHKTQEDLLSTCYLNPSIFQLEKLIPEANYVALDQVRKERIVNTICVNAELLVRIKKNLQNKMKLSSGDSYGFQEIAVRSESCYQRNVG